MKTGLVFTGFFLTIILVSFLIVTPEFALNPYYETRYHWSHLPTQAIPSPDSMIFEKFGPFDSGTSCDYSGKVNFIAESRYLAPTHTYYYKFANTGQHTFCVASKGLAYLTGNFKIRLLPGEIKYFVLTDKHSPKPRSYRLYFYESCGWFSYSGGSLEITIPLN